MIGGTPLLSGLFHDEPTIEFLNSIGVDTVGVGNHEFDEGSAELLRMQYGNRSSAAAERRHAYTPARRRLPSGRRLPGRHAVLRLGLPVPGGERRPRGHGRPAPAAVQDRQHVDRREDRVHRRDLREHAARRHPDGRRRARLPRRGRHGQRAHPAAEAARGRDDRAAAPPGRLPERRRSQRGFQDVNACENFSRRRSRRRRRPARRRGRRGRQRAHARPVRLHDRRPARHERVVVRPADHVDRPDDRPAHERRRLGDGEEQRRHADGREGRGHDRAPGALQGALRSDREPRDRHDHGRPALGARHPERPGRRRASSRWGT